MRPLKAIRAMCASCMAGDRKRIRGCEETACALYAYRLGKNPTRRRPDLTGKLSRSSTDGRFVKKPPSITEADLKGVSTVKESHDAAQGILARPGGKRKPLVNVLITCPSCSSEVRVVVSRKRVSTPVPVVYEYEQRVALKGDDGA